MEEEGSRVSYELVSSEPLPVIDLSKSFLSLLLDQSFDQQYMRWTARARRVLVPMFDIGVVLAMTTMLWNGNLGCLLAVPCAFMMAPLCLLELPNHRLQLVYLLATQSFEYWFLMILMLIYGPLNAVIIGDSRCLYFITTFIGTMTVVTFDADLVHRKGIRRAMFPALFTTFVYAGFLSLRVIEGIKNLVLRIDTREISLVDVAVNLLCNLGVVLGKNLVKGWQAHVEPRVGNSFDERTIRMLVYRCGLKLRIRGARDRAPFLSPTSTLRSIKELPTSGGSHSQLKLSRSSRAIFPAYNPLLRWERGEAFLAERRRMTGFRLLLFSLAAIGGASGPLLIFASAGTSSSQTREGEGGKGSDDESPFSIRESQGGTALPHVVVGALGLAATLIFYFFFAQHANRSIARWLFESFDVLFISIQYSLFCISLCDIMAWDFRCLGLLTLWLWFHCILLSDSIVPATREILGVSKRRTMAPVMFLILGTQLWMLYRLYFAPGTDFTFRTMWEGRFTATGLRFRIDNVTFTVSRLITVIPFSFRLLWKLLVRAEDELILLQGCVEYENVFAPRELAETIKEQTFKQHTPPKGRGGEKGGSGGGVKKVQVRPVQENSKGDDRQYTLSLKGRRGVDISINR